MAGSSRNTYALDVGSFLRSFTLGHVSQLDAVASRFLARLAELAPLVKPLWLAICWRGIGVARTMGAQCSRSGSERRSGRRRG